MPTVRVRALTSWTPWRDRRLQLARDVFGVDARSATLAHQAHDRVSLVPGVWCVKRAALLGGLNGGPCWLFVRDFPRTSRSTCGCPV